MTLVELLMTLTIVGILANLALPAFAQLKRRADATHVIADFHAIRLAAFDSYAATGAFPPSGTWGRTPRGLAPALPNGFTFRYKNVTYRWQRWSLPNGMPRNRSQQVLVGLDVRTPDRALLSAITTAYRGPLAFGSSTRVTLVIN